MQSSFGRKIVLSLSLVLLLALVQGTALAQYKRIILTSDQAGAPWLDTHLVNPWGLAFASGSPIWVSDNVTGLSTLYNGQGVPQSLVVKIASANGTSKGSPTGIVFNGSGDFVVSKNGASGAAFFIFATLDGTISGWSPGVDLNKTVIAVDNSASGTVYTGLAIASDINWLYAADAANNRVNVYDGKFNLVTTLTDPSIPAGFTPYGISVINHKVYVTYASPNNAPGGFIDVFGEFGNFIKRLASGGTLNQPWGLALAPSNFGPFSNALLVGNNLPNGTINAFNVQTGKFLGQLKDQAGQTIVIDQLWGLAFGLGGAANGPTNALFFTAGTDNYGHGRFGKIEFPH
jgi:uncharacterized protein (TIGR03118 family)